MEFPLYDASDLAYEIYDVLGRRKEVEFLSRCDRFTETFDFVARNLQEKWLFRAKTKTETEKKRLVKRLGKVIDLGETSDLDPAVRCIGTWSTLG